MSKFLHTNDNDGAADDTNATAIPWVFSENRPAKVVTSIQ